VALASALCRYPLALAIACTVASVESWNGPVYVVDDVVGVDPSVVY
jgi:hypothetical protein